MAESEPVNAFLAAYDAAAEKLPPFDITRKPCVVCEYAGCPECGETKTREESLGIT